MYVEQHKKFLNWLHKLLSISLTLYFNNPSLKNVPRSVFRKQLSNYFYQERSSLKYYWLIACGEA